ncbi:MAG: HAD family hydrolase [Candidatus Diapherotrites archaeon]|nr:HAD family hydrolase [Candidatus Diapherotrites archaeon]MDZ4256205.1 HAD family hydrolase [archaeon]
MAEKPPIKCIAFDIHGTLYHETKASKRRARSAKVRVLRSLGYDVSIPRFDAAMEKVRTEHKKSWAKKGFFWYDEKVLELLGIPPSRSVFTMMRDAHYSHRENDHSPRRISPRVKNLMRFLARKEIVTGVISDSLVNWGRRWVKKHELGIADHRIIISCEVNADKSRVHIFRLFLKNIRKEFPHIKAQNILMVGDSPRDMNARKAGFQTCWYNPKNNEFSSAWDSKPDYVIRNFLELKKILE